MKKTALLMAILPTLAQGATLADAMAAFAEGRSGDAAAMFHELAVAENPKAQFNLALLYFKGAGVPENHGRAFEWAWRAKLHGLVEAEALLAQIGASLSQEAQNALADKLKSELMPRAFEADTRAMLAIAVIERELRPEADFVEAYVWNSLAVALGRTEAVELRNASLALIEDDERLSAQEKATQKLDELCAVLGAKLSVCSIFSNS
ncbi:sel1 repeat family protein [Marivivens sp. LCG002]|uniref:sel1 repeat family protein n=1 Tax=Marivivens sp. LCG002 TaxID=3051171 RepID=UPI0025538A7C|nr:sel1 repeat family protein [Marivivens sp. LCG002]WIV51309.1 sel1 repeat family protein [Marivivens sp. LCG002]